MALPKNCIVKIYLIKRVVFSLGMRRSRRLKRDIQVRVPDISERSKSVNWQI